MIDPNSSKSIYVQIAESVENDILLGNLKEGEQAPSTNQFSSVYKINPATAGKGLNILVEEEILFKRRGLGMFVAEGAREKILDKRRKAFIKEVLPDMIREAERLEMSREQLLEIIKGYADKD